MSENTVYLITGANRAEPHLGHAGRALRAEHGIDRLDVVVANAGAASGQGVLETDPETEMAWDFEVNALGPARLFRGVWGLLERKDVGRRMGAGQGSGELVGEEELGQGLADAIGFKQPPLTVEQSVKGVAEQIDGLTPEKSGKFLTYTGAELPW
ncbi:hypothetical protein NEMBOFW57_006899 [Staphylotrichum longicolle]|uniref:Uncharacterized protein n=1 Tax=Staphylotrichum longicolle TaxID=669026 RepID=A0AAD4HZZ4_9PEZI|nr:hypothetical protein NEMBOFW57_006899 [Staphylotrichum longicolle]